MEVASNEPLDDGEVALSDDDDDIEQEDVWVDHTRVVAAVRAAREDFQAKRDKRLDVFKISLLGGRWQMERTGRNVYGLRCDLVKSTIIEQLASVWQLHKSASFEYNRYSVEGAEILIDCWMERMEFLAILWDEHGRPYDKFPERALDTFKFSAELKGRIICCLRTLHARGWVSFPRSGRVVCSLQISRLLARGDRWKSAI
eukprot:6472834-Amphidinium_carterae.5